MIVVLVNPWELLAGACGLVVLYLAARSLAAVAERAERGGP